MKTKVIAFRVTQEEYDAIALQAKRSAKTTSEWVYAVIDFEVYMRELRADRKKAEAKAKRDAKKAAANGAQ